MAKQIAAREVSRAWLKLVEGTATAMLTIGAVSCAFAIFTIAVHVIAFWVTAHADNAVRGWCTDYCPPFNQHGFWHMMGAYPLFYLAGLVGVGLWTAGLATDHHHTDLTIAALTASKQRADAVAAEELERIRSEAFPVDRLTLRPRLLNLGVEFEVVIELHNQLGEDPRVLTFALHRVGYVGAPPGAPRTDAFFPERNKGWHGPRVVIMTNRPPFWLRQRASRSA